MLTSSALGRFLIDNQTQAQKYGSLVDDDKELDEEGLLETPLDKLEPYGLFKQVMLSMFCSIFFRLFFFSIA